MGKKYEMYKSIVIASIVLFIISLASLLISVSATSFKQITAKEILYIVVCGSSLLILLIVVFLMIKATRSK